MSGGFTGLAYRPWVARDGMAGMFAHLSRAWGNPNIGWDWPIGLLERVCERGEAVNFSYESTANQIYFFAKDGIYVNGEKL